MWSDWQSGRPAFISQNTYLLIKVPAEHAELMASNFTPEMFRGKVCLELGSGIGLTGLVLAAVGPKKLIMTDYLEDPVLANLRVNVENSTRAC